MTRFNLSPKTEIAEDIIRWDAPKLLTNPALIEVTGSAAIDPAIPPSQKHVAERTLTIRMDVKAAARLSRKILDLIAANGD